MIDTTGRISAGHEVIYPRYDPKKFVGRQWLVKKVSQFRDKKDSRHLIIVGEPGSGKSAFLAYLAETWNCPRHFIRADNIGGVTGVDPRAFLLSIGTQLYQKYGGDIFYEGAARKTKVVVGLAKDKAEVVGRLVEELHTPLPFLKEPDSQINVRVGIATGQSRVIGERINRLVNNSLSLDEFTLLHIAVIQPLQKLFLMSPEEKVVLLIDALDESGQFSRNRILDVIPRVSDSDFPANLRLVMTSRPGDHLVNFREEDLFDIIDKEAGYWQETLKDTRAYIEKRLGETALVNIVSSWPSSRVEKFAEQVAKKSDGNFLYLYHFFNACDEAFRTGETDLENIPIPQDLDEIYRFFAVERIRRSAFDVIRFTVVGEYSTNLRSKLENFEGIEQFYVVGDEVTLTTPNRDKVLRILFELASDDGFKVSNIKTETGTGSGIWEEKFLPVLGMLAVAFEALSRDQLAGFCGVGLEYVDSIIARLLQFLDVVRRDRENFYRIYHSSFSEYLLDSKRNRDYPLEKSLYHYRIASSFRRGAATWAEVNWELENDPYPYRHLADHLIASGHSEQLNELLATGHTTQAWAKAHYKFSNSYADYLKDLEKAWYLSEIEEEWNLGLQIRYALVASSIRTIVGNIFPETFFQLVKTNRLTSEQALKDISLIPEAYKRAEALTKITKMLADETSQRHALDIAQGIADESGSSALALFEMVGYLDNDLKGEVLSFAKGIENEEERTLVLIGLVEHLPDKLRKDAVDAVFQLENDATRAMALGKLAENMSSEDKDQVIQEALKSANQIVDSIAQAEVFSKLVNHLPRNLIPKIIHEVLEATRETEVQGLRERILSELVTNLPDDLSFQLVADLQREAVEAASVQKESSSGARALVDLAPYLPRDLLDKALSMAHDIPRNTWPRAEALSGLADFFGEQKLDILEEALKTARGVQDAWSRALALCSVVDHLPDNAKTSPMQDALKAVKEIMDESWRVGAFKNVASRLPEELLGEALSVAHAFNDEELRAEALNELVTNLPEVVKSEVLEDLILLAMRVGDSGTLAEAVTRLIPFLPSHLRDEAMREAFTISRQRQENQVQRWAQARALLAFVGLFPPKKMPELLETTRMIKDESARSMVLKELASFLPTEVLESTTQINDEEERSYLLAELASHLPDESLDKALTAARTISNGQSRIRALRGLIARLSDERREELFYEFQEFQYNWQIAESMTELANHLSGELRIRALQIAIMAARAIEDDWSSVSTIAGMLGRYKYSDKKQTELGNEALEIAGRIEEDWLRGRELAGLANNLTGEIKDNVTNEALDAALKEVDIYHSADVLSMLLDHLSGEMKADVMEKILALVKKMGSNKEYDKTRIILRLLDHIDIASENLKMGMLNEGLGFEDVNIRVEVLGQLGNYMPKDLKARTLDELLVSARSIQYAMPRVEALVKLAGYQISREFTGMILREALMATREIDTPIYVGDEQAFCYRQIVSSWVKTSFSGLGDFRETCQETIRSLGSHRRWQFLLELGALVELINYLGGSSAISETYSAIRDGSRWWA